MSEYVKILISENWSNVRILTLTTTHIKRLTTLNIIQLLMLQAKCLSQLYLQRCWQLTPAGHKQKQQMHLLCWPQSMNSCTCVQAGQQCWCDLCLLLASQVLNLSAGNTAKDKAKSELHNLLLALPLFTRYLHVWPHTLVRALGFNSYSSIRSWTTSAWPSWAAKCSMVNPRLLVLWSRDCIFGARYRIVLTWPSYAALWRALCPCYMRETHNNWTHDWYNIGVDMDNGHWHKQECIKAEYTHSVLPHTYGKDTAMY